MQKPKSEITALVKVIGSELRASTLDIARGAKVTHHAVMTAIDKFKPEFEEMGQLAFNLQVVSKKGAGQPTRFAMLNEPQATYLVFLMKNSSTVRTFKRMLTFEFFRMRDALNRIAAQRSNEIWKEQRAKGKIDRHEETDTIALFIKYCEAQGSQNAGQYYRNITRMENEALFIVFNGFKGKKNIREMLNIRQLHHLSTADQIAGRALIEGMDCNTEYHDIFKTAKERVNQFAAMIGGKSEVPSEKAIEGKSNLTLLPTDES